MKLLIDPGNVSGFKVIIASVASTSGTRIEIVQSCRDGAVYFVYSFLSILSLTNPASDIHQCSCIQHVHTHRFSACVCISSITTYIIHNIDTDRWHLMNTVVPLFYNPSILRPPLIIKPLDLVLNC